MNRVQTSSGTIPTQRSIQYNGIAPVRAVWILLLLTMFGAGEAAAVNVSPTALYVDHRTRSGVLTLHNSGTKPEEIDISFVFGYPQSDAQGRVTVPLSPTAPLGAPSALGWIRAFPRRLVLQPGQKQVVRVMVQPPAGIADGEYWSRILITSRGAQEPIEQTRGGVQMQIDLQTVVVAALNYRNGRVNTGIRVIDAAATLTGDSAVVTLDMERVGNAAYLGRARVELVNPKGRVVTSTTEDLAVYTTLRRRITLRLPAGFAGAPADLRVRYTLETVREDVHAAALLSARNAVGTVEVD